METWKPIPGYEGIYEASNEGRIRTAPGKTTSNAKYAVRVWKSRVLKPRRPAGKKRQDSRVCLWKDGVAKDHLVSRLIASTWIGEPGRGMTVNHINGDWRDNRAENLELVSLSENIKKGFENGQYSSICHPVYLVAKGGECLYFRSKQQASLYLGRDNNYIGRNLRRGKRIVYSSDGAEFYLWEVVTA